MMQGADHLLTAIEHWGAIVAASGFCALFLWVLHPLRGLATQRAVLAAALAVTSLWLWASAFGGATGYEALILENIRNTAWLGFMYVLLRRAKIELQSRGLLSVYAALAIIAFLIAMLDLAIVGNIVAIRSPELIGTARLVLQMVMTIGSLVLVHNLYTVTAPDSRHLVAPYMAALTAMWGYDLNLYTITYLAGEPANALIELRPALSLLLLPLFMAVLVKRGNATIRLSRTVTFQTLSLMAIGAYLMGMVLIAAALRMIGGDYGAIMQKAFLGIAFAFILVFLPSSRFRAMLRVQVSKHFFQHRYDYRNEWMRFTRTIGKPGDSSEPFNARIIKAIADITESPGGLLLLPDEGGALVLESRRKAKNIDVPPVAADIKTYLHLQDNARIIDFDALRKAPNDDAERAAMPLWMIEERRVWVGVPLVHFDRVAGMVLLERPALDRTLDWEDFDLLRIVGRQVASYLAESQGQEALSEARRFEEFNRRFAFIIHDIKNLVSQLSLVARNAERHADNPEFRADMIETLQFSVSRMNDLLARLSQHNRARPDEPQPVALGAFAEELARTKRGQHPIVVGVQDEVKAMVDPARLEQILLHLTQNAIEASPASEPIQIIVRRHNEDAIIEVMDRGTGMTPDFIRNELFKPFHSTKEGGFGIGAFEARALAAAMGGSLGVESRVGEGSLFRLTLPPAADDQSLLMPDNFDTQDAA